ncbi:MAG: acyl-CoA reductase [Pseudoflavonifractor sp.]|nr:acyl-CoA reductase [Pseudoflavonifractor sp.]
MIFAHGTLLPDNRLPTLLDGLEGELNTTLAGPPLSAESVLSALDALGRRLAAGEFDNLLRRFLPAGELARLVEVFPLLTRDALEEKLRAELGPELFSPRRGRQTTTRLLPLGTLLHVAAGNQPGLGLFSVVEGLLTGNVNLLKLPREDKGLSLAALSLLTETAPELADFLYAFDLPSSRTEELRSLAALADGIAVWGGDGAVEAFRHLAPPGCRLIEWGHRLSFAYLSGTPAAEELDALADHIAATGQHLCSSCQVIFLDTADFSAVRAFAAAFLPRLEHAVLARRTGPWESARASLSGYTAFLERVTAGRETGEAIFRGRGCSVTARPDQELELSPMEGNVFVKPLPRAELLPVLRRQKGRLQTAGLLCPEGEREALAALLARAGVTRITWAGHLSNAFPGEGHDGEHPLRRYLRVVDVES